jgi:hypothetical protein
VFTIIKHVGGGSLAADSGSAAARRGWCLVSSPERTARGAICMAPPVSIFLRARRRDRGTTPAVRHPRVCPPRERARVLAPYGPCGPRRMIRGFFKRRLALTPRRKRTHARQTDGPKQEEPASPVSRAGPRGLTCGLVCCFDACRLSVDVFSSSLFFLKKTSNLPSELLVAISQPSHLIDHQLEKSCYTFYKNIITFVKNVRPAFFRNS